MNKEFDIDNIDFTKIIEIKNKYKCDNNYVEVDIALCNYEPEGKSYRIIIASFCTLNEIKVSSTCDNCNARKKETICDSFEEKNS